MKLFKPLILILLVNSCLKIHEFVEKYPSGAIKERYTYIKEGKKQIYDGIWSKWNEQGIKIEESEWRGGVLNGRWTRWYDNGEKKEESDWLKGDQRGVHKQWFPNGQIHCQGVWVEGKKEGPETCWHPNGHKKSYVFYQKGKRIDGERQWDETGYPITALTDFKSIENKDLKIKLKKHKTTYPDGHILEYYTYQEIEEGKKLLHGKYLIWFHSGNIQKLSFYRMGSKFGSEIEYFDSGYKKQITNWFSGEKEGKEIEWWEGMGLKKSETFYHHGKKDGFSRSWFENGNPKNEVYYNQGILDFKAMYWYRTGSLKSVLSYRKGKLHGEYVERHRDGSLKKTCYYLNGNKKGICKQYAPKTKDNKVNQFAHEMPELDTPHENKSSMEQIQKKIIEAAGRCIELRLEIIGLEGEIKGTESHSKHKKLLKEKGSLKSKESEFCSKFNDLKVQYIKKFGEKDLQKLAKSFDFTSLFEKEGESSQQ